MKLSLLVAAAVTLAAAQVSHPPSATVRDHLRRAAVDIQANDREAATKELEAVLALDPNNAEAYANLGVIAFSGNDYKTAARHLSKALALDPGLTKTQALLGICERRLGEAGARELLEKSFPKLQDKSLQERAGLELANLYYQRGNIDRTASIMRSLVDLDPDNTEILFLAQRVYSDLADGTLNKLAILAPNSARMQQVIAERLINDGDLNNATEHYRKALAIDAHLPGVHFELAEAILESAPTEAAAQDQAEKELQLAVRFDGNSSRTECLAARIAVRRADTNGAYAHYSRAFALNPADAEAQFGRGRMLANMQKFSEAAKYLRMAVQSDPLNEQAHYRLASVCRELQLKSEADKEFRLFREIKQTKENIKELYRQMNKKPPEPEGYILDAEP